VKLRNFPLAEKLSARTKKKTQQGGDLTSGSTELSVVAGSRSFWAQRLGFVVVIEASPGGGSCQKPTGEMDGNGSWGS